MEPTAQRTRRGSFPARYTAQIACRTSKAKGIGSIDGLFVLSSLPSPKSTEDPLSDIHPCYGADRPGTARRSGPEQPVVAAGVRLARPSQLGVAMMAGLPRPSASPTTEQPRRLLDQVRAAIRLRHYSRRTEEAYAHWIRRYIVFHHKVHPSVLAASDVSAFLTWLAEHEHVSASTQNQALSAVLFLYRNVLTIDIGGLPTIVRARTPERLPVVLSRDEVARLLAQLTGTMRLVVTLLYGSGLR